MLIKYASLYRQISKKMKIAIFCTSNDTSDFARRHITDDIKYINLLHPLRPDWQFDCFAVWQDEFPDDIAIYDGFILTGSPASARDKAPWIAKLFVLIRDIFEKQIPMFGGCFGHQAIALALGGRVDYNQKGGWSIGKETTAYYDDAPYGLGGVANTLYSIHKEEVTALPQGAVPIGRNDFCKYPAFVMGKKILTTQYHPEMTEDFLAELADELERELGDELPDGQLTSARLAFAEGHEGGEFGKMLIEFFEA